MADKPNLKEIQRVKKAIQAALPPLPDDQKARDEELRKRSSKFYRTTIKAGQDPNGKVKS